MRLGLVSALAAAASAHCVLHDTCDSLSRFGSPLPCVNSTAPERLADAESVDTLAALCGAEFANGLVCCAPSQVSELASNLKRLEPLIGSCPACRQNLFDTFCQFTCSPQQSEFVELVSTQKDVKGNLVPKEVNYFLDRGLAANTFDSCRNVKFSATNGRAMDLIGGGAKNYPDFFKFLGDDDKQMLGGSLFQITFPWDDAAVPSGFHRQNDSTEWLCGSGEKRCACIDCEEACPDLGDVPAPSDRCMIGPLRCSSLALLLSYVLFIIAGTFIWYSVRRRREIHSFLADQRVIEDDEQDDDDPFSLPSSELGSLNLRRFPLNTLISNALERQSSICARHPMLVIALSLLFVLCSSLGLVGMQLETDPINLWVAPSSREAAEKAFFDENFGAFYRTSQLFVVNETGPILQDYEVIEWLASIEARVAAIKTPVLWDSLDSFCLKPVGDSCLVDSITQYRVRNTPRWRQQLQRCTNEPVTCLPPFQQPIDPRMVFGTRNTSTESFDIWEAPALVITWVLQNSEEPMYKHRVDEWEQRLEEFMLTNVTAEAAKRGVRVSFNVESSIERELGRSGQTDAKIIILSYLLMFAYVSLSLGDSVWLGLAGIIVVLCSVASAVGILNILGYKLTLIITEVIPFLALAIGVDNIFLIVHQVALVTEASPLPVSVEDAVTKAVGSVGPSIVLSTTCEVVALLIAAAVPMPAVRNFAIYAAAAVLINSILQLTLFIALLTVYHMHAERRRSSMASSAASRPDLRRRSSSDQASLGPTPHSSNANMSQPASPRVLEDPFHQRRLSYVISAEYTPFLLRRRVRQAVVCIFSLWLAVSLYVLPQVKLGLDQRLAVPTDSFLVPYYSDVFDYFAVGPPVYFVVDHAHTVPGVERREIQQTLCSRFSTCQPESLVSVLDAEHKRPEISWLASAPASWIDDFLMWTNPDLDKCCLEGSDVCYKDKPWAFDMTGFPEGRNFTHFLDKWLAQPSDQCPLAGKAPYGSALSQDHNGIVQASHFRASHLPLRSQDDYIDAYAAARAISERLTASLGTRVFPYSIFYPFTAQYTTIISGTVKLVGAALVATCALSSLFLGGLRTPLIVTGVVASLVINLGGLMYFCNVSLNALSLVNLILSVGLGVEFCIHIARSFTFVPRVRAIGIRGFTKVDRAYNALAGTGDTVFSGVAITKFIGVCVLAFAHSRIFNIYYFRMWFALVIVATLHSLALLPVLLSLWGGPAWLVESESTGFAGLEEL